MAARYTVKSLDSEHLIKLTNRDIQGVRRTSAHMRSHPDVHYVRVAEHGRIDRGKRYSAEDVNASILARIAEKGGRVRVRVLYGDNDKDMYSSEAINIKEYSWDEMRGLLRDEEQSPIKRPKSGIQRKRDEEEEPEELDLEHEPEEWPIRYIVWEQIR